MDQSSATCSAFWVDRKVYAQDLTVTLIVSKVGKD